MEVKYQDWVREWPEAKPQASILRVQTNLDHTCNSTSIIKTKIQATLGEWGKQVHRQM